MATSKENALARPSHSQIERFVVALEQARRCLQLYPRKNPLVIASLETLRVVLEAAPLTAEERASQVHVCEVRPDGFYVGKRQLAATRTDIPKLALLLYNAGAKLLRLEPGATLKEAESFLDSLLALEGGSDDKASRRGLSQPHLGVELYTEAALIERAPDSEEIEEKDVLSYFLAQRKLRSTDGAPHAHLDDVLRFLKAAERGDETERVLFMDTFSQPEKVAELLSFVVHGEDVPVETPTEHMLRALHQTMTHFDLCMREFPAELRQKMLENLAEATINTDEKTKECILNAVLPVGLGQNKLMDDLTATLPARLGANVLLRHVQVHDSAASSVLGFLNDMTGARHDRLVGCFQAEIESASQESIPASTRETLRTLIPQSRPAGQTLAPFDEAFCRERLESLTKQSKLGMQVDREELLALREEVRALSEQNDEQQDTFTLFYLFAVGALNSDEHMLTQLQRALQRAMAAKEYDFINHVIQLALGHLRDDVRAEAFPTLKPFLSALYAGEDSRGFLNHLTRMGKLDPESEALQEILQAIAGDATPALFQCLETEEAKQRRFELLRLLLDMGPAVLGFLREQVRHPQWYVVRNAVYLLGRIPDEKNLPRLVMALEHEDVRVRREALKALGGTPGSGAVEAVARMLDDPEVDLRTEAAELLGRSGDRTWAPALADRLGRGGWRLRRHPAYALSLLQALAVIGGRESLKPLRKYLRGTLLPGTVRRAQVRLAARFALKQIQQRVQREEQEQDTDSELRMEA